MLFSQCPNNDKIINKLKGCYNKQIIIDVYLLLENFSDGNLSINIEKITNEDEL